MVGVSVLVKVLVGAVGVIVYVGVRVLVKVLVIEGV
jgi:preprotein translocase subunit Sss1